jgi:phosphoribosylformylglycinamidine cyclo-ligase
VSDQKPSGFTYQQAGVDNTSGARAKERIGSMIRETYTANVLGDFGHFGGMFRARQGSSQILVSSADSVGTKVLLAVHAGKHDQIGIDLVNHSVNDILCCGARPLFFLDYFAASSLDESVLVELVEGMSRACQDAGCALIGGETAQLPGIYRESTYDLAGFVVGSVEEDRIIDGSRIAPGQKVVGFASNGLHTNGYSLARAVFQLTEDDPEQIRARLDEIVPELGETLGDALLRAHRSYLHQVVPHIENSSLTGIAHITGGGIAGNLERIIPNGCQAVIDTGSWQPLPIFELIRQRGNVPAREMFDVFNMGIGLVVVAGETLVQMIVEQNHDARIVGEIREATSHEDRVSLLGLEND